MELVLQERSSKGQVKDYYSSTVPSRKYKDSPYLYKTLMDMVKSDSILFTAVNLTVDLATVSGYDFIGENQQDIEQAKVLFDDVLNFDEVVRNLLWQILVYGDAYLELRWDEEKNNIIELHPLETTEMRLNYTETGDIVGYVQKIANKGEDEYPRWSPDEIVYFRHYWIGSQVYSHAPFQSISRSFATKVYANNYLQSIFMNLPPKVIYFLKNASDIQRKLFIQNLIRAKTDPSRDIIAEGEAFESKIIPVPFDNSLISILEYLRKEILMITRVPPHWIGLLEGANRGIGENVVIPYETKIKNLQRRIASQVNKELLPKLGLSNIKFKWNGISLLEEKNIIENMGSLKSQGFDPDTIIDYAREHGLNLREGAIIEEKELEMNQQFQNDNAPSRKGENKSLDSMSVNLDKKGVSEEGKKKLEEKKRL